MVRESLIYAIIISLTSVMSPLVVTPGVSFSKMPGTSINVRCSSSGPFFSIRRTSFVNVGALVLVSASVLMPIAVAACFCSVAVRALVKAGRQHTSWKTLAKSSLMMSESSTHGQLW